MTGPRRVLDLNLPPGDVVAISALVREALHTRLPACRTCDVYLSGSEVRLHLTHVPSAAKRPEDLRALLQANLTREVGLDVSDWSIAFDLLPGRLAALACAARRSAVDGLVEQLGAAGIRVRSLQAFPLAFAARVGRGRAAIRRFALAEAHVVTLLAERHDVFYANTALVDSAETALAGEVARATIALGGDGHADTSFACYLFRCGAPERGQDEAHARRFFDRVEELAA